MRYTVLTGEVPDELDRVTLVTEGVNAFIQTFDTRRSEHMMMDSMIRKRAVRVLTQWMNNNQTNFRIPSIQLI